MRDDGVAFAEALKKANKPKKKKAAALDDNQVCDEPQNQASSAQEPQARDEFEEKVQQAAADTDAKKSQKLDAEKVEEQQ